MNNSDLEAIHDALFAARVHLQIQRISVRDSYLVELGKQQLDERNVADEAHRILVKCDDTIAQVDQALEIVHREACES